MSPGELAYRAKAELHALVGRTGFFTHASPPAPDLGGASTAWIGKPNKVKADPYLSKADAVLTGHFDLFALEGAELGVPPKWNRDPRTGTEAPLIPGKSLNWRDDKEVGNIKYLWEPNRHLQLVTLAQAYALTKAGKYLEGLRSQVESWLDQCPYLMGPNWVSALEAGIRLINWSLAWQLIGGSDSPISKRGVYGFARRWLEV